MSIRVKGLDKLVRDLTKFGKDAEQNVITELEISATNIEKNAIRRAPAYLEANTNTPLNIKQRIDKLITNRGLTVKVGVQGTQDIDAYVEFGTGLNFLEIVNARPKEYTKEIRDLAYQFYKSGDGTLKGTPYLFPSFFEETPQLIKRLKESLNELSRKA